MLAVIFSTKDGKVVNGGVVERKDVMSRIVEFRDCVGVVRVYIDRGRPPKLEDLVYASRRKSMNKQCEVLVNTLKEVE